MEKINFGTYTFKVGDRIKYGGYEGHITSGPYKNGNFRVTVYLYGYGAVNYSVSPEDLQKR